MSDRDGPAGMPRPGAPGRVRVLVFTTLFPNPVEPHHGIFVLERLRHVLRHHPVEATVVAPVPYFPGIPGFGRWSRLAQIPLRTQIDGITVYHPRYLVTPKVGMSLYPVTLALACRALVARLVRERSIDLIDAHYLYPDGVAAALLARRLRLPLVLTARGSDVTLLPQFFLPRKWLELAVRRAQRVIVVAQALSAAVVQLGAAARDVHVLRNGVDLEKFQPLDRTAARRSLGWPAGPTLLSVGHLIERKGHHLILQALAHLAPLGQQPRLVLVGSGPMRAELTALADELGLGDRVTFAGNVPHRELAVRYSAADCLVLASSREGWPNVLLEALACGTPVVATAVFGTPEVITGPHLGELVPERTPVALADAIVRALAKPYDRDRLRAHAEAHSWDATARGVYELFRGVLEPAVVEP